MVAAAVVCDPPRELRERHHDPDEGGVEMKCTTRAPVLPIVNGQGSHPKCGTGHRVAVVPGRDRVGVIVS